MGYDPVKSPDVNSRLEKFKKENPGGTWEDWVTAAFFARSSLLVEM